MSRESYRERLTALRDDVLYLAELVTDRLRDALEALDAHDEQTARRVIESDDEVNELYLELESDCVDLLALQQPVAGDLRLIVASFKILTDLERIGDLAVNLAEYALDAAYTLAPEVDVRQIGDAVVDSVEAATAAFAEEDAAACAAVDEKDDEIDTLCEAASETVVRTLVARDADDADELLSEVSRLLLTIRDLERVGDHAVNVAARTLFAVENDDSLLY
jgi:phosphate transport system protein|uniref:ABC transport system regulatory protein n=1 Tax=uncultured prokaryote 2E01B TaxID=363283 RepID=Q2LGQ1_9ZZZZ|nr:ABC transport system regulatory protein [uncultured prokaryote 2E01B]